MPDLVFDCIPVLKSEDPNVPQLLPRTGGSPGFTYCQFPLAMTLEAEREGWMRLPEVPRYTIAGEHGSVAMELMAQGEPLRSTSPDAMMPGCLIDRRVYDLTGIPDPHVAAQEAATRDMAAEMSEGSD